MGVILRIFAVLGVLALIAAIAFGVLVYRVVEKLAPLSAEASAYADASISAFGAEWDPAVLLEYASPELIDFFAKRPGALFQMTSTLQSQFGVLESADPSTCGDVQYVFLNGQEIFTTTCVTRGSLKKATVQFRLNLIKRAEWKLLGFFIEPLEMKKDPTNRLVNASGTPAAAPLPQTISFEPTGAQPITRYFPNVSLSLSLPQTAPIHVGASVGALEVSSPELPDNTLDSDTSIEASPQ